MKKLLLLIIYVFLAIIVHAQTPDANGIVYVKTAATGTGDGTSWANATNNLQGAINAVGVSQVWVAVGTHQLIGSNAYTMKNNVAIYGGFLGSETLLSSRNWLNNETILRGTATRPVIANIYFAGSALDNTAILDGFSITNGAGTFGGGIQNQYSSVVLRNLKVVANSATFYGGGIFNTNSSPIITNVIVTNNTSGDMGGGIFNYSSSSPILNNLTITGNSAPYGGGLGNSSNSSCILTNGIIAGNTASLRGGGIYTDGTLLSTFTNVKITGNSSPEGGGIYTFVTPITLTNATIAGNTASTSGGGIYSYSTTTTIRNSLILGNSSGLVSINLPSPVINNSIIEGRSNSTNGNIDATGITAAQVFTAPEAAGLSTAGDYSLILNSPAINNGGDVFFDAGQTPDLSAITTDIVGNNRIRNGQIDMGAYESNYNIILTPTSNIIYVKAVGTGSRNGSSWANATSNLQSAINTIGVSEVWVAKGIYQLAASTSYRMKNGVTIYGSFPDTGTPTMANRNFSTNLTTLRGGGSASVINNNYGLGTELTATAILDGFNVTNGGGVFQGGGINNVYASPTIRNVNFYGNSSTFYGGAIHNSYSTSTFTNVNITGNNGANYGGGLISRFSNIILTNVNISGNLVTGNGGAIFNEASTLTLTNVTISGNSAPSNGAIMSYANSTLKIRNSIIIGNTSGVYNDISTSTIDVNNSIIQGLSNTTNGNIDASGVTAAQVFTAPEAAGLSTAGDYSLILNSPAINNGGDVFFDAGQTPDLSAITTDIAGNNRIRNGQIDMGAYESPYNITLTPTSSIIYVKTIATGSRNGSSWANATSDLQGAIDAAGVGQVWVAKGIYQLAASTSYRMKNGVAIYGSFPDTGTPTMANRNFSTNLTTLRGGGSASVINNNYGLGTELTATAILDGFNVTNGGGVFQGGGMNNVYASPTIRNVNFYGNSSTFFGGGIHNSYSSATFTNVSITGNNGTNYGGGLISRFSNIILTNVNISGNLVTGNGGAIFNEASTLTLTNVTISGNSAPSNGAIQSYANSTLKIRNSIIIGNTSGVYNDISTSTIDVINSLIQGLSNTTNGNIDVSGITAAQVFTAPEAAGLSTAGDYSLILNSPAINNGGDVFFDAGQTPDLSAITTDIVGNNRIRNGQIDMGAYESNYNIILTPTSNIIYVKTIATGTRNGSSWANATNNLQGAIDAAGVGQVWVAKGIYQLPASTSFSMKNGVAMYGGFPDVGTPTITDRNFATQITSLKGDGSASVIYNNLPLNATAILDGFTITSGGTNGAGIRNSNASPTLTNVTISGNTGQYGGGIYNNSSSPIITNVTISGNSALFGSGIYNISNSSPILTNVKISGNTSSNYGGGVFNNSSSPILTNVTISGNTAVFSGGGIHNEINSNPLIRNSIILGNSSGVYNSLIGVNVPIYTNSLVQELTAITNGNINATGITAVQIFTAPITAGLSTAGDYTLKPNIYTVNTGNKALFIAGETPDLSAITSDLAGNTRIEDNYIEMGAYELKSIPQTITVASTITKIYGDASFAQATASSGLEVSYSSADSNIAEIFQDATDSNKWKIKIKKVGVVTITAIQPGGSGYLAATPVDFSLTINTKTLTLALNATPAISKTYNALTSANLVAANYTLTGVVSPDVVTVSGTANYDNKTVGTSKTITVNTFVLAGADAPNYTLSTTSATTTGAITAKTLTILADAKVKDYGDVDPVLTYTVTGLTIGDVVTGNLTRTNGENSGIYIISQGTLSASNNYAINFTPSNLTIKAKTIYILADAKTKAYGDVDPVLTYKVTGLINSDVVTGKLTRTLGEDIGTYAYSQGTLSAGNNYMLSFIGADFVITAKVLNIIADDKSKAFGTYDPTLTYTVNGLNTGDVVTGNLTRAIGESVGVYAISQGTLSASKNYKLNFTGANLAITAKVLTIVADAKTKVYGTSDPTLTYTVLGLATGDVITGSLTRAIGENVGIYAISKGTLNVGNNYTLNFTSANLAITTKALNIVADAKTKTYGSSDPALTYTSTGLIGTDMITGNLSRSFGENAGTYAISQGALNAGTNYTINLNSANLVINKAILTVKANNQVKCMGAVNPSFTLSYIGFIGSDNATAVNNPPLATTTATTNSAVGKYVITTTGGNATNYTFIYQDGELTINAVPIVSITTIKTSLSKGETIILNANGGVNYVWADANGIVSGQRTATLVIRPTTNTTYTVTATNSSGCSQTSSINIVVLDDFKLVEASNMMSPNGDGINDFFVIENIDLYPNNELRIFDKNGKVIYTKKVYDNSWNGTVNGSKLAEGTYYYILDFGNKNGTKKGFITIIKD